MKTWRECYFEPRQLVSDKWDHYFEIYDRCLDRHRTKPDPIYLEIGCQRGGGLETARRYFGDKAKVYGIDIDPNCRTLNDKPFIDKVFVGDQSNPDFLESVSKQIGAIDIVMDDGSHEAFDQIVAFLVLFPKLAERGTYLIEDTCCAFYPTHRKLFYGLTVFDYFQGLAEQLSANMRRFDLINTHYRMPRDQRPESAQQKNGMLRDIWSITFLDSVIAIEKAPSVGEPLRHEF